MEKTLCAVCGRSRVHAEVCAGCRLAAERRAFVTRDGPVREPSDHRWRTPCRRCGREQRSLTGLCSGCRRNFPRANRPEGLDARITRLASRAAAGVPLFPRRRDRLVTLDDLAPILKAARLACEADGKRYVVVARADPSEKPPPPVPYYVEEGLATEFEKQYSPATVEPRKPECA